MKVFFVLCVAAASLAAQDASDSGGDPSRRITAASQFFDHDYVNVFVFGNGIWDSRVPELTSSGATAYGNGLGWEAGGGITLTHSFKGGGITLNYRGSYRAYKTVGYNGGEQQSLALAFDKRLNRRWTIGASLAGGVLSYGSSAYSGSSVGTSSSANPFSSQSRYANAGVTLTYNQTRRLSYVFSGTFLLSNYNYVSSFSSYGGGGGASILYRLTARTTMGFNYNHTYFTYSHNAGSANIDGGSLSFSHQFPEHWQLDISGGVNRSHTLGNIQIPVSFILDGQTVTGYYTGVYNRTLYSPSYQAVITRGFRRSSFSLGGGQSVLGGNGVFLTSRNQFGNATFSYSTRHSNFSLGGYYSRLSSVSNTVSQTYATDGASASYGINLVRYVSANFRYDFLHYSGLFAYRGLNEHRVTFGISLSSKSVPLTLF